MIGVIFQWRLRAVLAIDREGCIGSEPMRRPLALASLARPINNNGLGAHRRFSFAIHDICPQFNALPDVIRRGDEVAQCLQNDRVLLLPLLLGSDLVVVRLQLPDHVN